MGKVFGSLCLAAVSYGVICGRGEAMGNAVLDGAGAAVELTLSLCGMMCLWCGIMRVLQEAGAISHLSRFCRPLLGLFFPHAVRTGVALEEISLNISANLLGLGNAATPLALRAMQVMQADNPTPDVATDDMVTLTVLNTASVSLLPTTVLALRRAAGSASPYAILVPVWICSAVSALFGLLLCCGCSAKRGE
ncbi:MAG: spore maturation protein A [Clostridia bacterium]|nr:spore maturation protein A [Clostridia bacterium]